MEKGGYNDEVFEWHKWKVPYYEWWLFNVIKWYVDASFAVHPDFNSNIRAIMTLGQGAM